MSRRRRPVDVAPAVPEAAEVSMSDLLARARSMTPAQRSARRSQLDERLRARTATPAETREHRALRRVMNPAVDPELIGR